MKRKANCAHRSRFTLTIGIALGACGDHAGPATTAPLNDAASSQRVDAAANDAETNDVAANADAALDSAEETRDMGDGSAHVPQAADGGILLQTCDDLANAVCGAVQACAPFWLTSYIGGLDVCLGRLKDECTHLEAAGTPVDMGECARALGAPYCHAVLTADVARSGIPDVCVRPRGKGATGAPCGSPVECQSIFCHIPSAFCGNCAARSDEGGPCTDSTNGVTICEPDLVCNMGTCTKPVAPGSPCTPGSDMRCPGGTFCANGVCEPWRGEGASCSATERCDNPHGLGCNNSSMCAHFAVVGPGQPCGKTPFTACGPDLACFDTCVPALGADGGCGPDAGGCVAPYWCSNSVCSYVPASLCK